MKCLFLTYENPYTNDAGDHIYTTSIINGLQSVGFKIDIVYYDTNGSILSSINQSVFVQSILVKFRRKPFYKFLFSVKPAAVINRYSKNIISTVVNQIQTNDYDFIFINHFKMAFLIEYVNTQLKKPISSIKTVFISHNSEFLLSNNLSKYHGTYLKRLAYFVDSFRVKYFEGNYLRQFDIVTAISENDELFFKSEYHLGKVVIIRPTIFHDEIEIKSYSKLVGDYKNIIIAGSFMWGPKKVNLLEFLKTKNFSLLNENGIKLWIVGKAEKELTDVVNRKFEGVEMVGPVKSTLPYYQKTKIAIIPEKLGGGFKLKIVEAAINKNLILAIRGAITSSNFVANRDFMEFDSFEELIDYIVLIEDKVKEADEIIDNAFRLVKNEYSVENLSNRISTFFIDK